MFILYFDILLKGQNNKKINVISCFLSCEIIDKDEWMKQGILPVEEGPYGVVWSKPQKCFKCDVIRSPKMSISASIFFFFFYKWFQFQFNDILRK